MRLCEVEAALREIVAGLEPERLTADFRRWLLVDTFVTLEKARGCSEPKGSRDAPGGRLQPLARCG